MFDTIFSSLGLSLVVFVVAAAVITVLGVRMSITADRLADVTGMGEAMMGGLFLAGATSLPDFAATLTAAVDGYAELAISNIMGSMAVNLAFLGIGDMVYRKANLEHAAASSSNLTLAALLIILLSLPLIAMITPPIFFWGIHPVTPVLLAGYVLGYYAVRGAHTRPMWTPRHTAQTVEDVPERGSETARSAPGLWAQFSLLAAGTAVSGWALMHAAKTIVLQTPLSETAVGALFTGVVTSMPELVTTIAAIRVGALTLAVGNILGTNCFNTTVIAVADIAYRDGSIYHAVTSQQVLWGLVTILMTGILLLGFVYRERYGIGRIGLESLIMLLVYVGLVASVAL
ncbi:MAG TPA: sodium:calcium antiporter [Gammaproteobacteria bacterium]